MTDQKKAEETLADLSRGLIVSIAGAHVLLTDYGFTRDSANTAIADVLRIHAKAIDRPDKAVLGQAHKTPAGE